MASNPAQWGGIETSVLDNGAGRGTRIAWVNTGSGLRYKVLIDRGLDIADAFINQHSLAWLSHLGITAPQPFSQGGIDWLRTFGGGLLTTCGLTHVGGPETDTYGERGLHDTISNTPAELLSVVQPDPHSQNLEMSLTGLMRQTSIFGPSLELKRTISSTLGQPAIHIRDRVTNRGNTPAPHMLLYHCNFGWPLADEGTKLLWRGTFQTRVDNPAIFRDGHDYKTCPAPLAIHSGSGEEVAFIAMEADADGQCRCGLYNESLGFAVALRFSKHQLPWLTNWQHCAPGEYVIGIEPGTHPPIGQAAARAQGSLLFLEPGQSKDYELSIEVLTDPNAIQELLKNAS